MTTNAGAEAIKNEAAFGFQKPDDDASYESMKNRVKERIEKVFRPEFLGRVDDVIVFHHLTMEDLKQVVDIELGKVRERLGERGLKLILTDEAKKFLIKKGSDVDFGARPLRRAIENFVEDPLSEELLKGEFQGKNHDHRRHERGRRQEATLLRRQHRRRRGSPGRGRRGSGSRRRRGREPGGLMGVDADPSLCGSPRILTVKPSSSSGTTMGSSAVLTSLNPAVLSTTANGCSSFATTAQRESFVMPKFKSCNR